MLEIEADWQQKKKNKDNVSNNINNNTNGNPLSMMGGGIMSKISNMISNDMKGMDINIDFNTNNNEELEKIMQRNKISINKEEQKDKSDLSKFIELNQANLAKNNVMNKTG